MNDLLNQDIQNVNIEDSIKESYLDYSMSVIVGCALLSGLRTEWKFKLR